MAAVPGSPSSIPADHGLSPGEPPLPLSLELAHAEIRDLREQVESLQAQILAAPKITRESSKLSDGTMLEGITTDELVAMRRVFDIFDTNMSGTISAPEMALLHAKLGEPLAGK